jgi:hypothetical protein
VKPKLILLLVNLALLAAWMGAFAPPRLSWPDGY